MNRLTLTAGIPARNLSDTLLNTVRSLRASVGVGDFRILVAADHGADDERFLRELKEIGAEVIWNDQAPGGYMKKAMKIIGACGSDILVLACDDIIFDLGSLAEILKVFTENPEVTMVAARILPLGHETFFEAVMASMVRAVDFIGAHWNGGDNYLAASGRCYAFRTDSIKKYRLSESIVNCDMFMYLENKRLGGKFIRPHGAKVYIKCPQRMEDQIGPSSRFQYSKEEMVKYFGSDVAKEYKIPISALLKGSLREFSSHLIAFALYFGVYAYTRLKKQPRSKVAKPVWEVDTSTKKV